MHTTAWYPSAYNHFSAESLNKDIQNTWRAQCVWPVREKEVISDLRCNVEQWPKHKLYIRNIDPSGQVDAYT